MPKIILRHIWMAPKSIPSYYSSIPLNPWSKVGMSGYLVVRIKKVMPGLVENMILRIICVVEKMYSIILKKSNLKLQYQNHLLYMYQDSSNIRSLL